MNEAEVKANVIACLTDALVRAGLDPDSLDDRLDLFAQGIVDSYGFLDLLETLEDRLDVVLDMAMLDEEGITTIGGLTRRLASLKA
jgi:acyl carrier protein